MIFIPFDQIVTNVFGLKDLQTQKVKHQRWSVEVDRGKTLKAVVELCGNTKGETSIEVDTV